MGCRGECGADFTSYSLPRFQNSQSAGKQAGLNNALNYVVVLEYVVITYLSIPGGMNIVIASAYQGPARLF